MNKWKESKNGINIHNKFYTFIFISRNFLTDIQSCITGQTLESLDICLKRYGADNIINSEEIWTVPVPILPEPVGMLYNLM